MVVVDIEGGPCGWEVDPSATGCCNGWDDYGEPVQQTAAILAASWMWAATARRYGQCEVTVEACAGRSAPSSWRGYTVIPGDSAGGWGPYLYGGVWFNGPAGAAWCCRSACELTLPGPIAGTDAVVSVITADGELSPGEWQVYGGTELVRTDGACWPSCCNGGTAGAAVTVVYLRGAPVPPDVRIATDTLACEFAAACTGGRCRLPRQVSSMTQMGTTVDFPDLPGRGIPIMATGIHEVDEVVKAHNPYGLTRRPRLINPNRPAPRYPM